MMNKEGIEQYIANEKVKAIYQVLYKGSFISMIIGSFFTSIYFWETRNPFIIFWILAVYAAAFSELYATLEYNKNTKRFTPEIWEKIIITTSIFTSLAWGSVCFFMLDCDELSLNYIFITLLLGVSLGGAFTTISVEKASFCYVGIIIFCLFLKTVLEGQDYYIWFVLIQVVFVVYCAMLIQVFNDLFKKSVMSGVRAINEMKLQQELQEEKLKSIQAARLASLGEMAAGISHEINNPLSLIRGRVDMLSDLLSHNKLDQSELVDFIESTQKSTDRINKIIQSMKNLSRIKDESEFTYFYLTEILLEVRTLVNHKLSLRGIKLEVENINHEYYADKSEVSQVILNLINNSIDAIWDAEDKRWIKIIEEEEEDKLFIHIIDSGRGIPSAKLEKVFDPFFTSKGVGKGTGLGLSLSKSLMARNRGDLYYNESFNNTCFTIELRKK